MQNIISIAGDLWTEQVEKATGPVLVDVFTPTCLPCRQMMPIIDKFAKDNHDTVKVMSLDASKYDKLASELRISAVPTLLLFLNGMEVGRKTGFQSEAKINSWIRETLS